MLYVLALVTVVGVDVMFFRHQFWEERSRDAVSRERYYRGGFMQGA